LLPEAWASSASGLEVAKAAAGYKVGESQGSYKTYRRRWMVSGKNKRRPQTIQAPG